MDTSGPAVGKINITELLENSRIGSLQVRVFALCLLSLVMDGFDVQALSYTSPAIVQEWGIPSSQLGPVFSIGNFGVLIGSLLFSMVSDKIGRRPVLIGATIYFAVLTLATAFAGNVQQLFWIRFVAGLGLGSIIPNATALIGEFSPKRSRVTLMMCISVGFTGGAALGGFVAAWLIPTFGWRSVFYFGGSIPLFIAVVMFAKLPESLQFLAVRRKRLDLLGRWLKELNPSLRIDSNTEYVAHEESRGGMPFVNLFAEGRGLATVLLWIVNFMNLLNLYTLSSWMPTVMRGLGYETQTAVLLGTILQVGGTLGTFGLAWMISKKGFGTMLTATFAIATLSVAMIGQPGLSLALLFAIVFVAGWCVIGSQPGINALAATIYPTYLRSTGVGWGLGIGRLGAIVGPYMGGELLAREWSAQQLFTAAALPAFIAMITMLLLKMTMRVESPAVKPAPVS